MIIPTIIFFVHLQKNRTFKAIMHFLCHIFFRQSFRNAFVYGVTFGFSKSITFFAYAATFRFGAWLVSEGRMDFEDVFK